jgi:hypothetical protein
LLRGFRAIPERARAQGFFEQEASLKLDVLFRIAAVYMAVVGLGLIILPGKFGVGALPPDASVELLTFLRLWGSPLLGIAVLDWMSRNTEPSKARDAIIAGNTVGFATIAAIDIWGAFGGGRPAHKVFAVVHLLFAIAFFWVGRRNLSASTARPGV